MNMLDLVMFRQRLISSREEWGQIKPSQYLRMYQIKKLALVLVYISDDVDFSVYFRFPNTSTVFQFCHRPSAIDIYVDVLARLRQNMITLTFISYHQVKLIWVQGHHITMRLNILAYRSLIIQKKLSANQHLIYIYNFHNNLIILS